MTEPISVIVSTYNREDALAAVLHGLAQQSDRHFEVIVADDGSTPETAAVVNDWSSRMDIAVSHVWHEDEGFRLAEIRNRAIAKSAGEICIFLDGDCIPRANFIAGHRRMAEPGWFVAGNRILAGRELTEQILYHRLQPELWGPTQWIAARMRRDINRLVPLMSLPLGPLRKLHARAWQGARGCNLAIRKGDLIAVDGFDASFRGWGLEDSDIVVRLMRAGVRRKDGRFATGVLHLWHPAGDRSRLSDNRQRLDEVIHGDRIKAVRGLSSLAGAPVSAVDSIDAAATRIGMTRAQ